MNTCISCLLFIINIFSISSSSELTSLLPDCSIFDKCQIKSLRGRRIDSEKERNCACDNKCLFYNDCCIDAKLRNHSNNNTNKDNNNDNSNNVKDDANINGNYFNCISVLDPNEGVFMINMCPSHFSDSDIRSKCENSKNDPILDPILSIPVTNIHKRYTYKNIFCSMCHNDNNITFWKPKITFFNMNKSIVKITSENFLENLIYSKNDKNWGIQVNNNNNNNISKQFFPVDIGSIPSETVISSLRYCKIAISNCSSTWNDENIEMLCHNYQGVIYSDIGIYRNVHCALCNNVNISSLTCKPLHARNIGSHGSRTYFSPSFAILLDINVFIKSTCMKDKEIFDPFLKLCRKTHCAHKDTRLINGKCIKVSNETNMTIKRLFKSETKVKHYINNTSTATKTTTTTTTTTNNNNNNNKLKDEFITCPKVKFKENEYKIVNDTTIYIPIYGHYFNSDFAIINNHRDLLICAPWNNSNINYFSYEMSLITTIGLSVSISALFLHLIAFILVSEFRNLSGHNLISLSISLIMAYLSFILIQFKPIQDSPQVCITLGYFVYYFLLSSVCWMNVMSFDVWRTLKLATNRFRVAKGRQVIRYTIYSIYAWCLSGIFVTLLLFGDTYKFLSDNLKPNFGHNGICWFTQKESLILFFATPIALIMIINLILFILTGQIINKASSNMIKSSISTINFKLYVKLWLLMGLTWIVGFLASFSNSIIIWYLFIILNTFHGLFIFLAFSCKTILMNSIKSKISKILNLRNSGVSSSLAVTHSENIN